MEQRPHLGRHRVSASSSSGRSLFARSLVRREGRQGEESDDAKGPLGLTTVFQPPDTVIADLIFVHGLGGGSQSTWTKDNDPSLFWPREWLPRDAVFRDVRIHTFGYNSNWTQESILNIHDFGKSLLGSIQDCPTIPRSEIVGVLCPPMEIVRATFYEFDS
jgi:hypothetical protein